MAGGAPTITLLAAVGLLAAAAANHQMVTPVQKVLQMLESMQAKGIKAKNDEQVSFAAFEQFCSGTTSKRREAIVAAESLLEKLDADISKAAADIQEASAKVVEFDEDIARWQKDEKAATDVREKEHVDYTATYEDYAGTVDACERAIEVLKRLPGTVSQSMLQTHIRRVANATRTPARVSRALTSFLEEGHKIFEDPQPDQQLFIRAPQAHAYESQAGGVIGMLEELRVRWRDERTDLEKEEMNARHNFEVLLQRLRDNTRLAMQQREQQRKWKAERTEDKAEAAAESVATARVKAEDEKYLEDLTSLCNQKSDDFVSRQKLRDEELKALAQAVDIISSGSVAGYAEKHLPYHASASLLTQRVSPTSLVQLRGGTDEGPGQLRAAAFLRSRATALRSPVLAQAAKQAADDPFAKVKDMIRSLIKKLLGEASAEADHKAWCDAELATNKQTRTIKAQAVDELTVEADRLAAESARLAQEIANLSDEIQEIDADMSQATDDRQKDMATNAQAVTNAKEAQIAVAQALAVLREFYAKSAEATALMQGPAEDAPPIFSTSYRGMGAEAGGVIGMLEVIESDFARLETDTDAAEAEAVAAYRKFMADSNEDKSVKGAIMTHSTARKQTVDEMLESTKTSLKQTQVELDAALAYYEKLRPSCVDLGVTFDERVARRQEEIQSLTEAYKILSGEDLPSLQVMKAEQIASD